MYAIIVNPAGAGGRAQKLWSKAEPMFRTAGVEYRVFHTTEKEGAECLAEKLTAAYSDLDLVVIGGDGTLNQVVNGIRHFAGIRLGFIPCGTGNDLARSLGLPHGWKDNARMILAGKTMREVNVGEVLYHNTDGQISDQKQRRRFNISAGIGFDAEVCECVNHSPWKPLLNRFHLGKLSYLVEALRVISRHQRMDLTVITDGKEQKFTECLLAVAMNQSYEGGGFCFCPHADAGDDLLDLCIGDHLSRFDFFRILPTAYKGNHLRFKGVYELRGKEIRFRTQESVYVHTDGEVECRSSDITIRLLAEKLALLQ